MLKSEIKKLDGIGKYTPLKETRRNALEIYLNASIQHQCKEGATGQQLASVSGEDSDSDDANAAAADGRLRLVSTRLSDDDTYDYMYDFLWLFRHFCELIV